MDDFICMLNTTREDGLLAQQVKAPMTMEIGVKYSTLDLPLSLLLLQTLGCSGDHAGSWVSAIHVGALNGF